MDAGLIAALGAVAGVVAGVSYLRQSLRERQVRLRLNYARNAGRAVSPPGILGLAEWPELPGGEPPDRFDSGGQDVEPAGSIAPPQFRLCERRTGRMAPALAVSLGLHAAFAVAGPEALVWISRALDAEQKLAVRFDHVKPTSPSADAQTAGRGSFGGRRSMKKLAARNAASVGLSPSSGSMCSALSFAWARSLRRIDRRSAGTEERFGSAIDPDASLGEAGACLSLGVRRGESPDKSLPLSGVLDVRIQGCLRSSSEYER